MQDTKEEKPPSGGDERVKLSKYKISSDANPREIFWAVVQAYKEGGDYAALVKNYSGIREALINIGCSVLEENPKNYRIKITKAKLALCIVSMIISGQWGDVIERALSNVYSRNKGPDLDMLIAFGKGFNLNKELAGGWLKEILGSERPSEAVLAYISGAGDREMVEMLKTELLNIARTEINEPQLHAMEALSILLPEEKEVAKLFLDMMDDWDLETKKLALETLGAKEIPDAGKKAIAVYAYEQDEKFRIMLERIVDRNRESCTGEFRKLFAQMRGKELLGVARLAARIYGRKAKEFIPEDMPKEERDSLRKEMRLI